MPGYLEDLTIRLASAVAALPDEVRSRHAGYLIRAQQSDGGFAGREGPSDLYYTAFALRSLAMLGELYGPLAERCAHFLDSQFTQAATVIELVSAVYGSVLLDVSAGVDVMARDPQRRSAIIAALESFRRNDGGYAKTAEGMASSTYHTFLVVAGLQLLNANVSEPSRIVEFIRSQRVESGAFREIRVAKHGSTNPTAAAIGTLRVFDALDERQRLETISFLASMQSDEGGLRANTRIPVADLLSTFTGVLTLLDLDGFSALRLPQLRGFVEACQREEGGFRGALWDDGHDVEYTFYGLGSMALCGHSI